MILGSFFPRVSLVVALVTVAAFPMTASAYGLLYDTFPYANGDLVQAGGANGGWFASSNPGSGVVKVSDGTISVKNNATDREDVSKPFAIQSATARTYMSFLLRVPSGSALVAGPAGAMAPPCFAHFRTGTADSVSAFRCRVYLVTPGASGDYRVGITSGQYIQASSPVTPWPADLTFDQTYRIVAAYDASTGQSSLWVNPVDESSPSVTSPASGTIGQQVAYLNFRQGTPTDLTNVSALVEKVGVGTIFGDALVTQAVPAVSGWATVILAGVLASAGGLYAVRRRRTVSG